MRMNEAAEEKKHLNINTSLRTLTGNSGLSHVSLHWLWVLGQLVAVTHTHLLPLFTFACKRTGTVCFGDLSGCLYLPWILNYHSSIQYQCSKAVWYLFSSLATSVNIIAFGEWKDHLGSSSQKGKNPGLFFAYSTFTASLPKMPWFRPSPSLNQVCKLLHIQHFPGTTLCRLVGAKRIHKAIDTDKLQRTAANEEQQLTKSSSSGLAPGRVNYSVQHQLASNRDSQQQQRTNTQESQFMVSSCVSHWHR